MNYQSIQAPMLVIGMAFLAAVAQAQVNQPQAKQAQVNTVRSKDGTHIAYERHGDGPPLILVGGALSDRSGGRPLAGVLAKHFTVITFDRRGRGDSGDTQPYSVEREMEDLEALINQFDRKPFLFGSSSGAALVLETSMYIPDRIAKQALFEPPYIVDDDRPPISTDFAEKVSRLVAEGRRGDAVAFFMTDAVKVPPEAVAQMRQQPMWAQMEKLAHTLAYDGAVVARLPADPQQRQARWASIRVPTLVIDGEASPEYLREAVRSLAETIPGAQRRTLAGQDHSAPYAAPELLVEPLTEFFLPSP